MAERDIRRVGVVGCGLMGSGIAEVVARAGLDVLVSESGPAALTAGREKVELSLARAVRKGVLSTDDAAVALDRIAWTTDLAGHHDRDLVVEAVAEDEKLKLSVFADLDRVVLREDAVLASNTSAIPIMRLGAATRRPQQVLGMHFFNPVPVLTLVEVVRSLRTGDDTAARTEVFLTETLGRTVVRAPDRAGFIVNALLVPYLLSAVRMLESGAASAQDIDDAMVGGCAHPMGPLHLSDLIGLDTVAAIAACLHEEFKEPIHAAPPLLRRMVDAGLLGRKSGQGFFDY